jgi:putative glutamine amidotransferase
MISLAFPAFYEDFNRYIPELNVVSDRSGRIDDDIIYNSKLVIFTGGSDINPEIYGEKNEFSFCDKRRDAIELEILGFIRKHTPKTTILGVCRGHQLICSKLFGIKLIQDINNANLHHGGEHKLDFTKEKSTVKTFFKTVNSMHHQGIKYNESNPILKKYTTSVYNGIVESFECLEENIFTVQFHPEFMGGEESKKFFNHLLQRYA